jgi:hypothetical protein
MLDMHTPLSLNLRRWFFIGVVTYLLTRHGVALTEVQSAAAAADGTPVSMATPTPMASMGATNATLMIHPPPQPNTHTTVTATR